MPSPAQTRRDPQKGKNGFSTLRGFTLIESMVVLAVLAIIASFALPSYRTLIEKRQVTSGSEQIGAFLSSAQLESVKRNQFVGVRYKAYDGGWCLGMIAGDTNTVTCDCEVAAAGEANACEIDDTLRVFHSSNLTYPDVLNSASFGGVDNTIVYDPVRGLIQNSEFVKMALVSDASSYALDIEVSPTGRVKVCSNKAADKDVPGYKECSS
jgi:prepilin-type N-terminal cleavage/methylation domain-containing protein